MRIGKLIQQYRAETGMERTNLASQLAQYGLEIPHQTIKDWEEKELKRDMHAWNPALVEALAGIFDKTQAEVLSDLGFDVVPNGLTLEDVELARMLGSIPNPMRRRRVVAALLSVLELLEERD
jgi:hypothetical protein